MVNIGLVLTAIASIAVLSQLPRITEFAKGLGGSDEGDSSTTIINEGDTVVVTANPENTSDGKPTGERQPSESDSGLAIVNEKITDLTRAFEAGQIKFGDSLREIQNREPTPIQTNPIFFETIRKQEPIIRRATERQIEENISQDLKFSTSLEGAELRTGIQIKRGTETFNLVKQREAERAEALFASLFGSVS